MNNNNISLLSSRIQKQKIRDLSNAAFSQSPIPRCETKQLLDRVRNVNNVVFRRSQVVNEMQFSFQYQNKYIDFTPYRQKEHFYKQEIPQMTIETDCQRKQKIVTLRNKRLNQSVNLNELDKVDRILAGDILNRTMRTQIPVISHRKKILQQTVEVQKLEVHFTKSYKRSPPEEMRSIEIPKKRRSMRRQRFKEQFQCIPEFNLSKVNHSQAWVNNI